MSKPPVQGASLLERAAKIYDFSARQDTRAIPAEELQAAPAPKPVAADGPKAEPPGATIAAKFLELTFPLPGTSSSLPPVVPTAAAGAAAANRQVAIDRGLLSDSGLLVPHASVGVLAEEFRIAKRQLLLTARQLAHSDPAKARTILICSAQPGDGKTYCAVNLAISIAAERDTRVVLVDADVAKPGVMHRLGVPDGMGLGLLDALADPAIDVEDCVVATDIENLSLLPVGKQTTSDTELIASHRTAELIARLLAVDPRRVLLFDSPPALAASPASVLALHAGQVMLVVRADKTLESEIRDAVQQLEGCAQIQLLLNKVAFSPRADRFGSYYGEEGRAQ